MPSQFIIIVGSRFKFPSFIVVLHFKIQKLQAQCNSWMTEEFPDNYLCKVEGHLGNPEIDGEVSHNILFGSWIIVV